MIIPSWLQNLVPPLPPGPAPPPSTGGQTGGSGTPDDPAVIVVIGQRPPPGLPVGYGPYGGMTGAEARAARDMAWAMSSPADRVRAMGLDPDASIDGTRDGDGLTGIGSVVAEMDFLNPALLALGIERVEISNRKAAHILSRHGLGLPNVSNFAPDLRNPLSLFTNVIAYGLQYPSIMQFHTAGNASNPSQPVNIDI